MVYLRVVIMAPFVSQLARLERLVSKQEDLLRDYRPPVHVAPLDPELKRKVRRDTSRTCWGWGGGAWRAQRGNRPRSSDFLSPLLYGGMWSLIAHVSHSRRNYCLLACPPTVERCGLRESM